MTYEQFQATKKPCADLGKALRDDSLTGQAGFLYLDSLYIETCNKEWWPEGAQKFAYHLLIDRSEWLSNDLSELEPHLYEFAKGEGYFAEICKQGLHVSIGEQVFDTCDPRHIGRVIAINWSTTATVRWNETGWISEVSVDALQPARLSDAYARL